MSFNFFMFPHDVLNRLQTSEKGLPAFFDPVRQWFQSGAGPWHGWLILPGQCHAVQLLFGTMTCMTCING